MDARSGAEKSRDGASPQPTSKKRGWQIRSFCSSIVGDVSDDVRSTPMTPDVPPTFLALVPAESPNEVSRTPREIEALPGLELQRSSNGFGFQLNRTCTCSYHFVGHCDPHGLEGPHSLLSGPLVLRFVILASLACWTARVPPWP